MFQGFTPETVDFMWGIRFNNERTWFEAHKDQYKTTLEAPMKELGRELYGELDRRCPDLGLVLRVCRIYRDARRLHGRGPYKDHLWLTISQPAERWSCQPVFWFELAPEDYSFGLGYWMAQASTMAKLRARMDRDPKGMEKLLKPFARDPDFILNGEDFKRPRQAPTPALSPWYNKKGGFSLSCERPHDELIFTPGLVPHILERWQRLIPLFQDLTTLDGDPDPRL